METELFAEDFIEEANEHFSESRKLAGNDKKTLAVIESNAAIGVLLQGLMYQLDVLRVQWGAINA